MKSWFDSYVFNYSWDLMTRASWRKYPNPMSPQVISVDLLHCEVDEESGVLRTGRLIAVSGGMPAWIKFIIGAQNTTVHVYEECEVDPDTQTMRMHTKTVSWLHLMSCEERLTYVGEKNGKTRLHQEAHVEAGGFLDAVRGEVEKWMLNRFQTNAKRGRMGISEVAHRILGEHAPKDAHT